MARMVMKLVTLLVVTVLLLTTSTHGTLTRLKHQIGLASENGRSPVTADSDLPSVPEDDHRHLVEMESQIAHMLESTEMIHGIQDQVSSVTQNLDTFLSQHASDSETLNLDHDQIRQILSTLQTITTSQQELEARHQRQIEQDHTNLVQLIETQKKQQAMLTQELEHSKALETQLAEIKQEQEHAEHPSAHTPQSDLQHAQQQFRSHPSFNSHTSPDLHEEVAHDNEDDSNHDGAFIELENEVSAPSVELQHPSHQEHDIDLSHTMDHGSMSELEQEEFLETQNEERLGLSAAHDSIAQQQLTGKNDPSAYASSSDYLAAMNSVDDVETMSPQQLQAFGDHLNAGGEHEIGLPATKGGMHSMSEIDSLVAEGADEHQDHSMMGDFDPSKLRTPGLKHDLSMLQDEESIQTAMLHAQAKIKAIAAELERHQQANGVVDHSEGIEIDMESLNEHGGPGDMGSDEIHYV